MEDEKTLDKIEHITIQVADIEASIRWYQSSFNCRLIKQTATFASLKFGNVFLNLTLPSGEPRHVGFKKADAAAFGQLIERSDGARSTYVSDPAGNVVKLIAAL